MQCGGLLCNAMQSIINTKMCEYKSLFGWECKEEALPNSKYCILHVDLPEDEESDEFKRINELKEKRVKEKISNGDFNFDGAKLYMIHFTSKVERHLSFNGAVIREDALFNGAEIGGNALFNGAEIGKNASFRQAKIRGTAKFIRAKIGEKVSFMDAEIGEYTIFNRAAIGGDALFVGAKMGRNVFLKEAEIDGDVTFDCTEIKGACSFKDAEFKIPKAQEEACRTARITQERKGDRVLADYHFYREMEAKRKQKYKKYSLKPILKLMRKVRLERLVGKHIKSLEKERSIYWGFLELPVQYIFGYGVHPWRVITTWLVTVFCLALVYWMGNGVVAAESFLDYLYFSVVTAATPGYGGYKPAPGGYQLLASFEAIFGTFMWAAFIATSARKYMR